MLLANSMESTWFFAKITKSSEIAVGVAVLDFCMRDWPVIVDQLFVIMVLPLTSESSRFDRFKLSRFDPADFCFDHRLPGHCALF